MKPGILPTIFGVWVLALLLAVGLQAQQDTSGEHDAGQASQPVATANVPRARAGSAIPTGTQPAAPGTSTEQAGSEDNPYDPYVEPPPLPKGKATLIGGIATSVDHVRNRITIQPFGGGKKVKVFVDERSHIYRNGTETTILGIRKGDRIYVDTLLDTNNKIFAKNARVVTETGLAEVRGQVIATNRGRGTISLRDQLSAQPVTFSVNGATSYSSTKGPATAADVQPGSLVDVQFSPRRSDRDLAREIVVVAKPGDDYIFSGVVTNLDMRTNSLFVDNHSDDQTYEVHFTPGAVADLRDLKVGSEVTAHAVFDGREYRASNIRIENSNSELGEQSKAQ